MKSRIFEAGIFTVSSLMSWTFQSINIFAGFLQGRFNRDLPLTYPKSKTLYLKRGFYSLNNTPRSYCECVKQVLLQLGGFLITYDSTLFLWYNCNANWVQFWLPMLMSLYSALINSFKIRLLVVWQKMFLLTHMLMFFSRHSAGKYCEEGISGIPLSWGNI